MDRQSQSMIELRAAVRQVLWDYHQLNLQAESILETVSVIDEESDNYLLLLMGWENSQRVKTVQIHLRLKAGQIFIEEDWTEEGVLEDLLRLGISPDSIVLAFHPPNLRQGSVAIA